MSLIYYDMPNTLAAFVVLENQVSNQIFKSFLDSLVVIVMDNVSIYSETNEEQHEECFRKV